MSSPSERGREQPMHLDLGQRIQLSELFPADPSNHLQVMPLSVGNEGVKATARLNRFSALGTLIEGEQRLIIPPEKDAPLLFSLRMRGQTDQVLPILEYSNPEGDRRGTLAGIMRSAGENRTIVDMWKSIDSGDGRAFVISPDFYKHFLNNTTLSFVKPLIV